ncbi:unnamed protein product, partial [Ectocarpus sp. 6 AP-2014]
PIWPRQRGSTSARSIGNASSSRPPAPPSTCRWERPSPMLCTPPTTMQSFTARRSSWSPLFGRPTATRHNRYSGQDAPYWLLQLWCLFRSPPPSSAAFASSEAAQAEADTNARRLEDAADAQEPSAIQ